jgi:hypothetical protein
MLMSSDQKLPLSVWTNKGFSWSTGGNVVVRHNMAFWCTLLAVMKQHLRKGAEGCPSA